MIIKIHKPGRSFKGVIRYLAHDVKAETTERVAWTHTLSLAHDDTPSAVDEMLWTFRAADVLKREAGVGTGGKPLEKPVKHFSLAWSPDESPTKEHMIETVRAYMEHMGWQDRQAVLFSHTDKKYAHVHVVMNSVSPLDGRAAPDSNDWRKTEAFALQYERDQGRIYCEQRLKPQNEREATPTREAWQSFKPSEKAFERDEAKRLLKQPGYFERKDERTMNGREWEALKAYQKQQRERFFVEGKAAYRAVRNEAFREVREEFRPQWNAYYAAKRHGHDRHTLAAMKLALVEAQNRALEERRKIASDELREQRDRAYEAVLAQQQVDRKELGLRQQQGLRTYAMFDVIYPAPEPAKTHEPPAQEASRWTASPARTVADGIFRRDVSAAVDPVPMRDGGRTAPGVVHRQTAPLEAAPSATRAKETPPAAAREMTEAAVERQRASSARELRDGQAEKDQREQARVLRASWNRHRGSRGRRD